MEYIYLLIGFILLIKASDYFVDVSIAISKKYNIPEIVVGATIISIGTTLPETMVSAVGAIKGHGGISFGNALGSIICNTALIGAISIIFSPSKSDNNTFKRTTLFFTFSFLLYAIFAYLFNGFNRVMGFCLVAIFIIYIFVTIFNAKNSAQQSNQDEIVKYAEKHIVILFLSLFVLSLVIAFASNLLVDNGIIIAKNFGVPESVIGITIIALGTSLPEFTTTITSLIKKHSNLSIGNIIGANFLNIVTVTGIASILSPFKIPNDKQVFGINSTLVVDCPVAALVMFIMCFPTILAGKTKRWQGIVLIIIYTLFIVYQYLQ